jgi:hypothetical protein
LLSHFIFSFLNFKQMVKELLFVPLFEKFIKETANGKRRKLNGENCLAMRKLIRSVHFGCWRPQDSVRGRTTAASEMS